MVEGDKNQTIEYQNLIFNIIFNIFNLVKG